MPQTSPGEREDYDGQIRIRADYDVYYQFWHLADGYYSYEAFLRDVIRVADDHPDLFRSVPLDIPDPDGGSDGDSWG